eukprot:6480970-Amphidinium_carterae.2
MTVAVMMTIVRTMNVLMRTGLRVLLFSCHQIWVQTHCPDFKGPVLGIADTSHVKADLKRDVGAPCR